MVDLMAAFDKAPRLVRLFVGRIATGQGTLGRLADRLRYPYDAREMPQLPDARADDIRLLIGPNNTAEQAYQWARAVEREIPASVAVSMYGFGNDAFEADVDLRVPENLYLRSEAWHVAFEKYLATRTHVIWESGLSLLGRRYGMSVESEVRRLMELEVSCGLLFHGSDIRRPSLHAAASRWSPFAGTSGNTRKLEEETSRNASLAAELGVSCFVSTPDLLQWLPGATWCPVVVDPTRWKAVGGRDGGPPVVAHAPTNPWIKGTNLIEPMLQALSHEGIIDYRQTVGVSHAAMPAFYAGADVVLDQFTLGTYGVAACEAMASGRLVMSHVDDLTRAVVRDRTGLSLPVHEATVESLEGELRHFAADPEAFTDAQAAGPAFVSAVHDGRRSASALAPFLGTSV